MRLTKAQKIAEAQKEINAAIEDMGSAMQTANLSYMRDRARFTPNMTVAWDRYIVACRIMTELQYQPNLEVLK